MKLIKTESGIIAVSEELKTAEISGDNNWKNRHVIAGTPDTLKLKLSPEVATFLGVWDVLKLSQDYQDLVMSGLHETDYMKGMELGCGIGFIAGFEKRSELSKKFEFTEEDMLKAMNYAGDLVWLHNKLIPDKSFSYFIQSLRNKEFKVESFEKSEDTLTVLKLK